MNFAFFTLGVKLPFISVAMLLCKLVGELHIVCVVFICLDMPWYLGRCSLALHGHLQHCKPLTGFCQLFSGCLRTKLSLAFTSQDKTSPGPPSWGAPTGTRDQRKHPRDHCKPPTFSPAYTRIISTEWSPSEERFAFSIICFIPFSLRYATMAQNFLPDSINSVPLSWICL